MRCLYWVHKLKVDGLSNAYDYGALKSIFTLSYLQSYTQGLSSWPEKNGFQPFTPKWTTYHWIRNILIMCREKLAYTYKARKEQNREKAKVASIAMALRDRATIIILASVHDPKDISYVNNFCLPIREDDGSGYLNVKRQKPKTCAEVIEQMPIKAVNSRHTDQDQFCLSMCGQRS